MKIRKIICYLISLLLISENIKAETVLTSDTIGKYLPLNIGNVFVYDFSIFTGQGTMKTIISKDTIVNTKKYFHASPFIPEMYFNWIRVDSLSGIIYALKNFSCQQHPFEVIIDSLKSRTGDSSITCNQYAPIRVCTDSGSIFAFGETTIYKVFESRMTVITSNIKYAKNFGVIFTDGGEPFQELYLLRGCVIDDVVYGDTTLTSVNQIGSEVPESNKLYQNYPNPFNPITNLEFGISNWGFVILKIYNLLGSEVSSLVNENKSAGIYNVEWDASDFPSGVYLYKFEVDGNVIDTKRMILLK